MSVFKEEAKDPRVSWIQSLAPYDSQWCGFQEQTAGDHNRLSLNWPSASQKKMDDGVVLEFDGNFVILKVELP